MARFVLDKPAADSSPPGRILTSEEPMSGERTSWPPSPQPGGRSPAPEPLGRVQAFINTHYDLAGDGGEQLSEPGALASWLTDHRLLEKGRPVGDEDLRRALRVREGLRALALANHDARPEAGVLAALDEACAGAPVEIRVGSAGPRFVADAAGGVPAALGLLLGWTAQAMLEGGWRRLKACPGEDCGWAFYDASRNQTGRWCSMAVCGGRAKARTYYRRRTGLP